jgi:hypothetical protein
MQPLCWRLPPPFEVLRRWSGPTPECRSVCIGPMGQSHRTATLYSCTCPVATYISLDANGETLVVKIWGWGALIGHSSNMYSTIGIKWYVRGNRACAYWDIQTCISSLEYSALLEMDQRKSSRLEKVLNLQRIVLLQRVEKIVTHMKWIF